MKKPLPEASNTEDIAAWIAGTIENEIARPIMDESDINNISTRLVGEISQVVTEALPNMDEDDVTDISIRIAGDIAQEITPPRLDDSDVADISAWARGQSAHEITKQLQLSQIEIEELRQKLAFSHKIMTGFCAATVLMVLVIAGQLIGVFL